MIRLRPRPAPPASLTRNKSGWTDRWKQKRSNRGANWATDHARRILIQALSEWAYGKCAFCESCPDATGYLEIEHFVPKSISEELTFEWTNLFSACPRCNRSKGEGEPGGVLIRPDGDNPEEFLWVNPATGELGPAAGLGPQATMRVAETIVAFDLNRGGLMRNRREIYRAIGRSIRRAAGPRPSGPPEGFLTDMAELLNPWTQYKLVIRQAFQQAGSEELVQEDRRRYDRAAD
jgi:uncharacterized protein (TIGR02646 family)